MTKRILRIIGYLLLASVITFLLLIAAVRLGAFGPLPTKTEIGNYHNAYASRILASDGSVLGDVHSTYRLRLKDQQIPEHLKRGLIAVEDLRFYEHKGVDTKGLLRALGKNLLLGDRSAGGGSTLSQQLVKNMFGRNSASSIYITKLKEMILARRLEKVLSKDEILTLYLNTVPFGENLYGVEAASQRFFGKSTDRLLIQESATLVGMLKANTVYNPRLNPEASKERRDLVLQLMDEQDMLAGADCDSLQALPLTLDYTLTRAQFNGYLNQVVEQRARSIIDQHNVTHGTSYALERDGLLVQTSIEPQLQSIASESLYAHLDKMQEALRRTYLSADGEPRLPSHLNSKASMDRDSLFEAVVALHGGFLSMDVRSGAVLAYIGGKDFNRFPYDQIQARRMMASTFKPFIYAAALEQGMHPCDHLENNSMVFEDHQEWEPRNYDRTEGGRYSLAAALARSLNIPAVRLYTGLDRGQMDTFWRGFDMGRELPERPAAALGTLDASILDLSQAYSAFPNRGNKTTAYFIERILTADGDTLYQRGTPEFRSVCDPHTADQLCAMLQMSVSEGTATSLRSIYGIDYPFAAKTGTSQEYRDAWIVGFNKGLLFTVRVGANDPDIHFTSGQYGASTKLALPILGRTLAHMDRKGVLKNELRQGFLPTQHSDLDCEHYVEDGPIRRLINDWRGNRTTVEDEREQGEGRSRWSRWRERIRDIF